MSRSQGRAAQVVYANWDEVSQALSASLKAIQDTLPDPLVTLASTQDERPQRTPNGSRDAFYIILPMLIVLSTFLFLLLLFLICVILLRRRRGIMLRDSDGPIDMSREDLIEGEGGFEGVESRWLETVSEPDQRAYHRAKGEFSHRSHTSAVQTFLNPICFRISDAVPSQLHADRYHLIPVPLHPREGCISMVVRTRF